MMVVTQCFKEARKGKRSSKRRRDAELSMLADLFAFERRWGGERTLTGRRASWSSLANQHTKITVVSDF